MPSTIERVTLKDIASHCGVSPMTVSWALRGDRSHVSEQTRQRVCRVADELGYDPSRTHAARRLRYSSSPPEHTPLNNLVAASFSWGNIDTPYFTRLLKGLGEVVQARRYSLLTDWQLGTDDEQLPPVFARGEVDGVIGIEGSALDATVARLRRDPGFADRPVVTLFGPVDGCAAVLCDDRRGGCLLAHHLLERGHRYLAYAAVEGYAHAQRQQGYRDALEEAGLDPARHLRPLRFRHDSRPDTDRALREELTRRPSTTALLAGNDYLALRLADACARLGLEIPGDLALAGYDDTHVLPGADGTNRLTTVRYSQEAAGRQAAELLIDAIEQRQHPTKRISLPVELVVRGSSG